MKFDLHTHSTASDGTMSPLEMWEVASTQALNYFALTDHDTFDGYLELANNPLIKSHTTQLISGIEISSAYFSNTLHIVALNVDVTHPSLTQLIKRLQLLREKRAKKMVAKLAKVLQDDELYQKILAFSHCPPWLITRPHIARYLVSHDLADNEAQVFKRWLSQGKQAFVQTDWPDYTDVIQAITEAGGVSVLAHPLKYGKMTRTKIKAMIEAFSAAGGHGIEVAYSQQSKEDTKYLSKLCEKFDLHASGGSDYHGPHMSWAAVGKVPELPESCRPVWALFN